MRKLILNVAISLDGLIKGPNGEFDWCFTDQDYGMTDFLNRIDLIFYGRKSYELMMKEGGGKNPFGNKKSVVFSKTLGPDPNYTLIKDGMTDQVRRIKSEPGKDIWLFGGADLSSKLLNANLVDELLLAVHPIVLGKGKPMFAGVAGRLILKLLGSKVYSTGLVSLHYQL